MRREWEVESIREMYTCGSVIVCDHMEDQYPVPDGTKGKVLFVDDAGQIHVRWENGSGLALVPGVDSFHLASEA